MNILIYGIGGKMGKMVLAAAQNENIKVAAGVDKFAPPSAFNVPVYTCLSDVSESFDVIIDFSVRESLNCILPYAVKHKIPCVLATTGYSKDEFAKINEAAKFVPIFQSGNMSLGVNILQRLTAAATAVLKDKADVEIVETHHNQKVDAPSGTAYMLLNAVLSEKTDGVPVYGREGITGARKNNQIGMHAIRGGTVVGKHEIMFLLNGEVITLKHEAESKMIFASGAIKAAKYLICQPAGLYNMATMLPCC
jgi:4-hydroxy-tetrahydrodipicolinate reductase